MFIVIIYNRLINKFMGLVYSAVGKFTFLVCFDHPHTLIIPISADIGKIRVYSTDNTEHLYNGITSSVETVILAVSMYRPIICSTTPALGANFTAHVSSGRLSTDFNIINIKILIIVLIWPDIVVSYNVILGHLNSPDLFIMIG